MSLHSLSPSNVHPKPFVTTMEFEETFSGTIE